MSRARISRAAFGLFLAVAFAAPCRAQNENPATDASSPSTALAAALSAACRANQAEFANYLTAASAAAFRNLPADQRDSFLKRFSLTEDSGRALVSTSTDGHAVVRCQSPATTTEFHFGEARAHDNLAFIPVDVKDSQRINFGLVREDGAWRLISLGLVLLDVPELAKQWSEKDSAARESAALAALHELADAIHSYQRAYGKLPDSLAQMGPAAEGQTSPDQANLINAQLAGSGVAAGYQFRYRLSGAPASDSTFEISATPAAYGKSGLRSFFLDAAGNLHAADKHGAMASASDPEMEAPSAASENPAAPTANTP
jgi:hypothetical protein